MDDNPYKGIHDCQAHVVAVDEDCEWCERELAAKQKVADRLVQSNESLMQSLMREGAHVDPINFLKTELDLLVEVIFKDPRQALHFQTECNRRINNGLKNTMSDVRRAKLTLPTPNGKRIVKP